MQCIFDLTSTEGVDFFCVNYKQEFEKENKTKNKINYLGKISFIQDPDAKLRPIGIIDYYSQLYLKILNDNMFIKIKNLSQDRTFTQNPLTN
jgi:hypothetical protein